MTLPRLPDAVMVRDVGPRDGLQPERPLDPADRVRLVEALVRAGVRHIEATAFVSPRAVPAMAGAAEVMAALPRRSGLRYAALVPNLRGAAAGAVPVDAVISCAFGSPYEGDLSAGEVLGLSARLRDAGCTAITCADTTGMATPRGIAEVVEALGADIGLHLHETRGTALVCAYAALLLGVTHFDTSVGGLGGSPFAEGAAGNLATEGFVAMLDDLGVHSGIDVEAMIDAAALAGELVGRTPPSPVARAGPRTRLAGEPVDGER